jgi:hypothetical protein
LHGGSDSRRSSRPGITRFTLGEWQNALKDPEAPLNRRERHCGLTLATFMGWHELQCWPSVELLARTTGCAQSTVRLALTGLEAKGYLRRRRGFGRGNSTRYYACLPGVNANPAPKSGEREGRKPPIDAPETPDGRRLPNKNGENLESSDGGGFGTAPPTPKQEEVLLGLYAFLLPAGVERADDGRCDDCGEEGGRWRYATLALCLKCHLRRDRLRKGAA